MDEIVIVGGGLSGLSAAWELENLGVPYTLVEVKPRLGGSIWTERRAGYVLDGTSFILEQYAPWTFLEELGLNDALLPLERYRDGQLVVFKEGTGALVDALAARLHGRIFTRMAVSSIGQVTINGKLRCGVCLENGLMLEAAGVIVAAPARYAEHMLYSLEPEAASLLLDYQYDPTARVHLGYADGAAFTANALERITRDHRLKFVEAYTTPGRVPEGNTLVRAGVRVEAFGSNDAASLIGYVREQLSPAIGDVEPVMTWVHFWPEADPLTRYLPEFRERLHRIETLLPPNVALVGSDYRARRLDEQVAQGRAAARKVAAALA